MEIAATLLLGIEGKYLETRFGKLPTAQVDRFQEMSGSKFFFVPLIEKVNDCWCIYSASSQSMEEVDHLFAEAGFEKAWVPNFSEEDGTVTDFAFEAEIRQLTEQKQLLLAAKERGSSAIEQLSHMENCGIRFTDIRPGFVATPLLSGDGRYPMLMRTEKVAARIMHVLRHPRRRVVIDRRYALMVFFWKLIPEWLWERLNIRKDD